MISVISLLVALAAEPFSAAELKATVYKLASPEFAGRKGPGGDRAAEWLAGRFKEIGLAPAFGDSYFQPIPWLLNSGGEPKVVGRNVGAMIAGDDPALRDEWIVLSAHYDHLGQSGDTLYPGADDNASSVAMLLEVAKAFAQQEHKPKRTILFVSFDLEEQGLQGSTHFAAHPPRPFDKLKAFLTADLLGRSMANIMDEYVYVLGSETAPGLRKLVTEVTPAGGLKVGRLGADLVGTRSDYGPFRDRRVPFLFFTTGTHPDYHKPTDLPERLDYAELSSMSRWIYALTQHLADGDAPSWEPQTAPDLDEAQTVLELLARALVRAPAIHLTDAKLESVQLAHERLSAIVRRGKVTPEERTWLVWTARRLIVTVFQ